MWPEQIGAIALRAAGALTGARNDADEIGAGTECIPLYHAVCDAMTRPSTLTRRPINPDAQTEHWGEASP